MMIPAVLVLLALSGGSGDELPRGQITADVKCAAAPSHSYAVYLPTRYTPDRAWPVILAFDPGGRGRMPVERYQAAAEQYGFIVAGSNTSRNGDQDTSQAVIAMTADVQSRFAVDPKRVYTAGMSGGARVALWAALSSRGVAGVIASSAGYPDGKRRKRVDFPIFATAGTEDFNHLEMRQLDEALTSPHHLAIFEGGHTWLSSELAIEAVEWMEIQAMKAARRPRDEQEIDQIFSRRVASARAAASDKERCLALASIAADFEGLRDVAALSAEAAALAKDKRVREALKKDREEDGREERMLDEIRTLEFRLTSEETRTAALSDLRSRWKELAARAAAADDSADRRVSRRVLAGLSASVTAATDPDYLAIIGQYRTGRGRRGAN
jgi:predicted esterase